MSGIEGVSIEKNAPGGSVTYKDIFSRCHMIFFVHLITTLYTFNLQPAGWKLKKEYLPEGWICLVSFIIFCSVSTLLILVAFDIC